MSQLQGNSRKHQVSTYKETRQVHFINGDESRNVAPKYDFFVHSEVIRRIRPLMFVKFKVQNSIVVKFVKA